MLRRRNLLLAASQKPKPAHPGLYKDKLNSDVVSLSAGGPTDSGRISGVRFLSALQISLLWRTPWTYATFARAYGSASESRKREIRVSDEDDDDVEDEQHIEDDDNVEDEQRIEDDDYDDEEEEEEEEGEEENEGMQSQGTVKKKIQTKPSKSKVVDQHSHSLNQNITAKTVRLVNDGEGHRVVSREEALALAKDKNLDLVLVDGRANPPVCKIFDFHKEEYRQEQVKKDRKKKKGAMVKLNEVKELRFNSKTESKDLKMKVEKARQFMNRGHRVKFVAVFKGSSDEEKKRQEQEKMIDAIYPLVEDIAVIEQGPRVELRQAWVMLRHVKFGQVKRKTPKGELQIGATDQIENVKHEGQLSREEPDVSEGLKEENTHPFQSSLPAMPAQNSVWESAGHSRVQSLSPRHPDELRPQTEPPAAHACHQRPPSLHGFGGLRGSEITASTRSPPPSTPMLQGGEVQGRRMQVSPPGGSPLHAHEAGHSHLQSPPPRDFDEGLRSQMQPPPPRGFPQHTPAHQGFGGLRGFETPVSPLHYPLPSTPPLQGAGVQSPRMQVSPPGGSPLNAGHSHVQPPPPQGPYEGLRSGMQPPSPHGFPQHRPSLQGFGDLRGSEIPVSPPRGPALSTPTLQGAGAQGSRMLFASPGGSPLQPPPLRDSEEGLGFGMQPPPLQDPDEGLKSGMQSPPFRGFPQHTPSMHGFGGLQSFETLVPPPRGPPPPTPMLQGAGVQGSRMLFPPGSPVHAHEAGYSHVQPPLPRDPDEGVRSGMQPPPPRGFPRHTPSLQGFGGSRGSEMPVSPPRGFPQHTPSLQGFEGLRGSETSVSPPRGFTQHTPFLQDFGGVRGSETPVSPPPGPPPTTPMLRGAGVQGARIQVSPPRGFPPHAHEAGHSHGQSPPLLDLGEGFRSGMQPPPPRAFPQHTPPQQGFGGLRGSETLVSPPRGPPQFTPRLQGAGVQGPRMQVSPPGGFPLREHEAGQSHGKPPPPQDADEGLTSGMQPPPFRGFPQHTQSLQGFGGLQGSEALGFQRDNQSHSQNQASQGYPPQRGFPQTRPAQEAYSSQGDGQIHSQSQVSQGYPPQRGFPQTRPVVPPPLPPPPPGYRPVVPPPPPPPGYRPSWSMPPPQSQEYSPLFESPSKKS